MAGIFGFFDYNKPGKGIEPDEPEKRALFRYLDLLWRKLSNLFVLNVLYFICILPLVLVFHLFFFEPVVGYIFDTMELGEYTGSLFILAFSGVLDIPESILISLTVLSALALGPLTCGFTYILRNYIRGEHAWYSDFWQTAQSNFKQGIFLGILDILMFCVGFFNISLLVSGEKNVPAVLVIVSLCVFLLYLSMRNTLYLMAVTIKLTNAQLIRNALILSVLGLPRHLLIFIINTIAIYIILFAHSFTEIISLPLIAFSWFGFTSVFICYPLIEKYLIKPQLEREQKEAES